ncbi:hypothetical protein H5410_051232, partial [Solanum commersonii]
MARMPSKLPVCQALKEKIKLAIERSSRQVAEWFRNAVLDLPKVVVANATLPSCFWLARERGIGLTWVQLKRVNPKPFSTHSARESEWTKAKAVLNICLLVFEKNQFDS